jgi:hypothetical protein
VECPEEYIVATGHKGMNDCQIARSTHDTSQLEVIPTVVGFAVSRSDDDCLFVCRDTLK